MSYVWLGTALEALFGFLTQVLLARHLGAELYGVFVATLGVVGLVSPLAGFGVSGYWLKCFGEEGWSAMRWLKPSLRFVIYTTLLVLIFINMWGGVGPNDEAAGALLHILSWTLIGTLVVELVGAKLQLEERFARFSLIKLLPILLKFIAVVFLLFCAPGKMSLVLLAWGFFIASMLVLICVLPEIKMLFNGTLALQGHGENLGVGSVVAGSSSVGVNDVFREVWVFGAVGVLYLAWNQGHIVLAKYALGDIDAGIYSSAMVLINAICLLPSVAYSKFMLPKIHRWANHDLAMLAKVYLVGNRVLFLFGVFAMLVTIICSSWVVLLVFGEGFGSAGGVLAILALTFPVRFLGYSVGSLLVAKDYIKLKLKAMFGVALFNFILAFLAMPLWGLYGLAFTVVLSELVLVLIYYVIVSKRYGISL